MNKSQKKQKKKSTNFADILSGNSRRKKKNSKSKKWLYYTGGVIGLFLLILLWHYPSAKAAYDYALEGQEGFIIAQGAIGAQDFTGAKKALIASEQNLEDSLEELDKLNKFKIIPLVGRQINAVEYILTATMQLGSGLQDLTDLGDQIFSPLKEEGKATSLSTISPEQTEDILKAIYESPPMLQGVKADIDLAVQTINNIPDSGIIGPIKKVVTPLKEQLPAIQSGLELAIPAAEALPQIAGYPVKKTYLFLLQNNSELRPTGGFIGTYGILKLRDGAIDYFETDNIYNLDTPYHDKNIASPPWQLKKYLSANDWFMRDSNWSPDFPTAAEQAEWFYRAEGGPEEKIDGVIAVTPTFIESLISVTGEILVSDILFTSDNFLETLQYQVEKGFYQQGISEANRKEIIGVLSAKLLDRVLELPSEKWPEMWETFQEDLAAKHILIYLKDDSLQQLITEQRWGGSIQQTNDDYLFVVDANMASLKTDPGVIRTINYSIEKDDSDDYIATARINYNNQGTFSWKSTRYRTYTRVYVPLGSELIEYDGVMENDILHGGRDGEVEVTEEFDKTVFGGFISIEPQEQGELVYKYKLPESIALSIDESDDYKLFIQKQGGTAAHKLNVDLSFEKKIMSYAPIDKGEQDGQNRVTFSTELGQDSEFNVIFK